MKQSLRLRANRALRWAWGKVNRPLLPTPKTANEVFLEGLKTSQEGKEWVSFEQGRAA